MKKSRLKHGMMVRISNDLTKTYNGWGVTKKMKDMKGKIYKVDDVDTGLNAVYIDDGLGDYWTFCPEDLHPIKMTPPIAPVMFDVNNLELAEQNNK